MGAFVTLDRMTFSFRSSSAAATWTPGNVSVRLHSKGPQGAKPKGKVVGGNFGCD